MLIPTVEITSAIVFIVGYRRGRRREFRESGTEEDSVDSNGRELIVELRSGGRARAFRLFALLMMKNGVRVDPFSLGMVFYFHLVEDAISVSKCFCWKILSSITINENYSITVDENER